MPTPRIRRLISEKTGLEILQRASSFFAFSYQGEAPTQYTVSLSCKGLARADNVSPPLIFTQHRFDILLDDKFPNFAPKIVWKTPVFHPNIAPPQICLGDHWYPAWNISKMCVAICEMVQYKTFNIYDPLNRDCALWLHEALQARPELFPVDKRPVVDLDFDIVLSSSVTDNAVNGEELHATDQ